MNNCYNYFILLIASTGTGDDLLSNSQDMLSPDRNTQHQVPFMHGLSGLSTGSFILIEPRNEESKLINDFF